MKALFLGPALLMVASPAAAQSGRTPYRALGTEPFWSLTIDGRTIRYTPATGRGVSVATPRPIVGINGDLYRTARISVDITHTRCSDGMSDRVYADTVRVRIGRQVLNGCGGAIVGDGDANALIGTWRIDALDGRAVRLKQPATVTFAGNRLSGTICNGFGGTYRLHRGTLTTRDIIGTQMACMDGRTQVETALFAALRNPLKVSSGGRANTLVFSSGRSSVTLQRVD